MYTLVYTPPGGGAPVSKTFAAWGIGLEWKASFKEQEADEMTMTLPAGAIAANPFQFKGTCVVLDDDGETIIFQGVLITDPRSADPPTENIELTWAGPWWYLEGLPYELQYPDNYGPGGVILTYQYLTHFVLNKSVSSGFLFSKAQITAILDFAIAKGAPLQYVAANIPDLPVYPEVVLNISCANALRKQIADYDAVMWFDHSTSPPTFNCAQRANAAPNLACTAVTRACGPERQVIGFNVKERYDLRVPFVQLTYEEPVNQSGGSYLSTLVDLYPNPRPAPPNSFYPLIATIPINPYSQTTQNQYIQTLAVAAESVAFWQALKPELANATEYQDLGIVAGSGTRISSLPNVIIAGMFPKWATTNSAQKDSITALFNYTTKNDTVVTNKLFQLTKTATDIDMPGGGNLSSTITESVGGGAAQYIGMAQAIYNDLNARCWEGSIPIFDAEWTGNVGPGNVFNVSGAFADWAAMNAPVREVAWSFGKGGVRGDVRIGPNKKLTPGAIMDRMKAWRLKFMVQANYSSQLTGQVGAEVSFPDQTYAQSLTEAPTVHTALVVGTGAQSVTPAAGAAIMSGSNPPAPAPPNTTPSGTSYNGVIQRDVAATANEEAGVWGRGTLRAITNAQGFTDVVLEFGKVDVAGALVGVPFGGVDGNGNPTGSIAGQIVMKLSDTLGLNIALMPTLACDSSGNKLYGVVLRSAWSTSPIPGVTYT